MPGAAFGFDSTVTREACSEFVCNVDGIAGRDDNGNFGLGSTHGGRDLSTVYSAGVW